MDCDTVSDTLSVISDSGDDDACMAFAQRVDVSAHFGCQTPVKCSRGVLVLMPPTPKASTSEHTGSSSFISRLIQSAPFARRKQSRDDSQLASPQSDEVRVRSGSREYPTIIIGPVPPTRRAKGVRKNSVASAQEPEPARPSLDSGKPKYLSSICRKPVVALLSPTTSRFAFATSIKRPTRSISTPDFSPLSAPPPSAVSSDESEMAATPLDEEHISVQVQENEREGRRWLVEDDNGNVHQQKATLQCIPSSPIGKPNRARSSTINTHFSKERKLPPLRVRPSSPVSPPLTTSGPFLCSPSRPTSPQARSLSEIPIASPVIEWAPPLPSPSASSYMSEYGDIFFDRFSCVPPSQETSFPGPPSVALMKFGASVQQQQDSFSSTSVY